MTRARERLRLDAVADKVLGYRPKEAKKKLRKKARKAKKGKGRAKGG